MTKSSTRGSNLKLVVPPLPTGRVKSGSGDFLQLAEGRIEKGKRYMLPRTGDGKTAGKNAIVTDISLVWEGKDTISFFVRLEEDDGQGWQFQFFEDE